jgi:recombination protein RecA
MFGSPETTPGGRALKFYSSIRGQISKGSPIKDGEEVVGFRPKIKFVKNKVGPPFTEAEFDICFGCDSRPVYGIDGLSSLIETATDHGIIERKGSHYKYLDTSLGNGTSRARQFLAENPNIANDISQLTYSKIFGDINQDEAAIVNIADEIIDEDYGDDE